MKRFGAVAACLLGLAKAVEFTVVPAEDIPWTDARVQCQNLGDGWDLASVHSRGEMSDLYQMAADANINHFWIGLYDTTGNGGNNWVWSDGTKFDFEDWAPGQPDLTSENYGEARSGSRNWNDLPVGGSNVINGYACGKHDSEILVAFADSVLVFRMPVSYTYHRANLFCETHGYGQLTSIHDTVTKQAIVHAMTDLKLTRAWIGIKSVGSSSTGFHWEWEDGSAINYEDFHYGNEIAESDERGIFRIDDTEEEDFQGWDEWDRAEEALGFICTGYSFAYHVRAEGDWMASNSYCKEHYERGQLITIHTATRNSELIRAFKYHKVAGLSSAVWMGYRDDADEAHWYWVDGTPTLFEQWTPGQPDNKNSLNDQESCGAIWYAKNQAVYGWNDGYCESSSSAFGFICGVPNLHANSVVTKDGRYRVTKYEGNWEQVRQYCWDTYGTHPASIRDDDENEQIRIAGEALDLDEIWIGYEATAGQVWEWTDGSDHDYDNWGPGMPVAHEHAQMIVSTGYWQNVAGSRVFAGVVCNTHADVRPEAPGLNGWPIEWNFDGHDNFPVYHGITGAEVTTGPLRLDYDDTNNVEKDWYTTDTMIFPEGVQNLTSRTLWVRAKLFDLDAAAIFQLDSEYAGKYPGDGYKHRHFDGIHYNEQGKNTFELGTEFNTGEDVGVLTGFTPETDTFYEIVLSEDADANTVCLYVDGELYQPCITGANAATRFDFSYATNTTRNLFGYRHEECSSTNRACFMRGHISYAAMYNRALSAEEVKEIYDQRSEDYPSELVKEDNALVSTSSTSNNLYFQLAAVFLAASFIFFVKTYAKPHSKNMESAKTAVYGSV